MIKNITREIEPKIDKGIKLILVGSIINLLFATLIDIFITQWIINALFCSVILFEFFVLNKNLDFIYLLDIKKEDIYNNLMVNYFKIGIILLTFTYFIGMAFFNDYILGMSLIFPIFIFITSFLLEYVLTKKISSIIKYIIVAIIYITLINSINIFFWVSISYIFIKANSFFLSGKKDYKFIKNNLFLNFSILLYISMFVFIFKDYFYYQESVIVNYMYNYSLAFSNDFTILFLIGIFISFSIYFYFKKKYNLKSKNKIIDIFFMSLVYLLLIIKVFYSYIGANFNTLLLTIGVKIFIAIIILILIFISSKINFKPKKIGDMYDKYL